LRTAFELGNARPESLSLVVYHDEDVEVFINGVSAVRHGGHIASYQTFTLTPEAVRAIKPGRNIIAVSCHQTAGEQFIDVGLGFPDAASDKPGKEHDLLLDGPVKTP
jgi:hypothetical protein